MTTSNRAGPQTEPVLPSSRQPVPGSEQFERTSPMQREQGGERGQGGNGDKQRGNGDKRGGNGDKRGGNGDKRAERRSAAEIEADIDATTQRLSATVDELAFRLSPAQIAKRSMNGAKGLVITSDGRPRAEVIGALAGALVGTAFLLWRSRRR
ncbi:MAG TPA: DUF3618 domain-containing protein [Jiangellaceae bacterium]